MQYKHIKVSVIIIMIAMIFTSCQKELKYKDSYVIAKNEHYGLIDSVGNEIVPPIYVYIGPIQKDGVSLAVIDTIYTYEEVKNKPVLNIKYGYINSDNKFLFPRPSIAKITIENSKDSIKTFSEFCDNFSFYGGLAIVQDTISRLYGYIKLNGDTIISPKYTNARIFNQGRAAVQMVNGKWGLINSEGQNLCDFVFTTLETPVNGRGIATIVSFEELEGIKIDGELTKYGKGDIHIDKSKSMTDNNNHTAIAFRSFLVDDNGKIKEELDMMYRYSKFSKEGIAVAIPNTVGEYLGLGYNFITKEGKFIKPLTIENLTEEQAQQLIDSKYFLNEFLPKGVKFRDVTRFSDGYAAVNLGLGWIFVDTQLIPRGNEEFPTYEYVLPFAHGLAGVKIDGKFGYINNHFEIVIPCGYDSCAIAGKNLCRVYSGEKSKNKYAIVSYIDRNNNVVWQSVNYGVTHYKEQDNGKWEENISYEYIGKNYTPLWIAIIIVGLSILLYIIIRVRKAHVVTAQQMQQNNDLLTMMGSSSNTSTNIAQSDKTVEKYSTDSELENDSIENREAKSKESIEDRLNHLLKIESTKK